MSEIEEDVELASVDQLVEDVVKEEHMSSRRSSFVERTRLLQHENEEVGDYDIPASSESISPSHHQVGQSEVLAADVDETALYDEVDGDWMDKSVTSEKVGVVLDEFVDIPEVIGQPECLDAFPADAVETGAEGEVEEELEERQISSRKTSFVETEVVDDVDKDVNKSTRDCDEIIGPANTLSKRVAAEKVQSKSFAAERAAVKMHQADAAEAVALTAMKEKENRKAALNTAKRQHDDLTGSGDKKAGGLHGGVKENGTGDVVKASRSDQDVGSEPPPERSKGFLHRIRKSKVPAVAGSDSVDERSATDTPADPGKDSVEAGAVGSSNSNLGPKPPRRKLNGVVGRPGRRIASSTTEDGADAHTRPDSEVLRLPPLVHPRSSPDPSQLGDEDSMKTSDNGEPSLKIRRHRKPLFLRMIERAQQQTLEDERQKNEQYAEQKKVRQRNNPTAEQLREHRLKHDEMMRSKQEESRRSMVEAAAVNARAVKKLSQPPGVDGAAPTGDATPTANDDASTASIGLNVAKKKKKKASGATAGVPSKHVRSSDEAGGGVPLPSKEGTVPHHKSPINNLSPPKKLRGIAHGPGDDSRTKNPSPLLSLEETEGRTLFPRDDSPRSDRGAGSPVRNVAKRATNGNNTSSSNPKKSAIVASQLPDLTTVESVAAFCAPDWMAAFARLDLDEVNNDIEANSNLSSAPTAHSVLQPPPPSLDAQNLMERIV